MIEIYVDGSCRQNKIGGYGFIVVEDNEIIHRFIQKEINTTNQRMELSAILSAFQYCKKNNITDATIFSDSSYCLNCAFEKWYIKWESNGYISTKGNSVLNKDLWEQIIPFYKEDIIKLSKVPGHKDCYFNNFIDSLVTTISSSKTEDLTDKKFGKLTVLQLWGNKFTENKNSTYWLAKCECGKTIITSHINLHSKMTQSCGCMKKGSHYEDLSDQIFGFLKPVKYITSKDDGYAIWECLCMNCNTMLSVSSRLLKSGQISCGCIKSKGEYKISQILQELQYNYKREVSFDDCKDSNKLKFDFAIYDNNYNLIALIEYQGKQHSSYSYGKTSWNTKEHFDLLQKHDEIKRKYCKENNIKLIEIPFTDYNKLDSNYLRSMV